MQVESAEGAREMQNASIPQETVKEEQGVPEEENETTHNHVSFDLNTIQSLEIAKVHKLNVFI